MPPGIRDRSGELAEEVRHRDRRDGWVQADRGECRDERRDVEDEVPDGSGELPVGVAQLVVGGVHAGGERAQAARDAGASGCVCGDAFGGAGAGERRGEDGQADGGGQERQRAVARSGKQSESEAEADDDERGDVRGAGEHEDDGRALGDAGGGHALARQDPGPEAEAPEATGGQHRVGGQLRPCQPRRRAGPAAWKREACS